MTIGKRIGALRRERNISQEYLAHKLGVSRQAVSKWENGQSAPDTYHLIELAELLGVSVEYLATGCDSVCNEKPAPDPVVFGNLAMVCYLLPLLLNIIGYITGHFDMIMIPMNSRGDRMGIYLGYGESPFAIILLVLEVLSLLAAIILTIQYFRASQHEENSKIKN